MHPWARAAAVGLPFIAVFLSNGLLLLFALWSVLALALLRSSLFAGHIKFAAVAVLPILVALLLVWLASSTHPPTVPIDWRGPPGIGFALLVALRILVAGAILQALIIPVLAAGQLPAVLRAWGIGEHGTQIVISSVTLLEDLKRKVRQVVESRTARGLMPTGRFGRLLSLPALLRPVFFSSLEAAVKRAELWEHRGVDPLAVARSQEQAYAWTLRDTGVLLGSFAVLAIAASVRLAV